jgi:hypothetical protein
MTEGEPAGPEDGFKSISRELVEEPNGKEESGQLDRQQHDPAGLGDSDKIPKLSGLTMNEGPNANDFPNVINPNTGFNNGMDYNQMMQFMSGNMGGGLPNFNPMMGKFSMHSLQN